MAKIIFKEKYVNSVTIRFRNKIVQIKILKLYINLKIVSKS